MDAISLFPTTDAGAQHASTFGARTKIEVQDANGDWVLVPGDVMTLPKPPEFSRPYAFDVSEIWISNSRRVRFTFLFKTYLDWVAVDTSDAVPVTVGEVPLVFADLRKKGIDRKKGTPEVYEYVYGEPNDRTAYFEGYHTKLGEVSPLLADIDDRFVIFGGGDELALGFDARGESDVPEGSSRRYLFFSHGYYKDAKVGLDETVEPLPFNDMSDYPYPDGEKYPDDEFHVTYQAEWNTRYQAGARAGASILSSLIRTPSIQRSEWRDPHRDAWVAAVDAVHYSVNTDQVLVSIEAYDGSISSTSPIAGWASESAATSMPTPASPGASVDATTLAALGADDGVYWVTDLASVDRNWNWQIVKYNLGASALTNTKSLSIAWNGHGEPTAGYNTAIYAWNPTTDSWTLVRKADIPTDRTVGTSAQTVTSVFCMRCHDGAPPTGVVFPAGVVNVGAEWIDATTGDFHDVPASQRVQRLLELSQARNELDAQIRSLRTLPRLKDLPAHILNALTPVAFRAGGRDEGM